MRLIDADALIELLKAWKDESINCGAEINNMFASVMIVQVKAMPTIEPEWKKGKWIYGEDQDVGCVDGYWCDQCDYFVPWDYKHKSIDYIEEYKYCPNCGAEMSGGDPE